MSCFTGDVRLLPSDTSADWDDRSCLRGNTSTAEPVDTATNSLEHLQAEVSKLGGSKDRYSRFAGPEFRARLADSIRTAEVPRPYIDTIVRHCSRRPWQEKIYDGADVLAQVPGLLCQYAEADASYPETEFADRVWLLATALAWADDERTAAERERILRRWLSHNDPAVREVADSALEEMRH